MPAPRSPLHGSDVRVLREAGRTALPTLALPAGTSAVWDGRFRVRAAIEAGADIDVRALGSPAFAELRQQLAMPRDLPARAAATLPAFWRGEELIVVPTLAALGGASPAWGMAAAALFGRIPRLKAEKRRPALFWLRRSVGRAEICGRR